MLLPPCLYLRHSQPSSTPIVLSSLMSGIHVLDDFSPQSTMHWQILAISFNMFLFRGFNDSHMLLPLALIPVTHRVCFTEIFRNSLQTQVTPTGEIHLDTTGAGVQKAQGYKEQREGHTIDITLQKRLQQNNSKVEIRVLDFQNQQILTRRPLQS